MAAPEDILRSARSLAYTTSNALVEYSVYLSRDEVQEIQSLLDGLNRIVESGSDEGLTEALRRLEGASYRIAMRDRDAGAA